MAQSPLTMKDKKSIAIVMLAAITAGVGIFSIVSNKSKLDAFAKLETDRDTIHGELKETRADKDELMILRDQLDSQNKDQGETIKTQGDRIEELGVEVAAGKKEVNGLNLNVEQKTSEIETLKLQHAQDLGALETKFQEVSTAQQKAEADLKVQTDLVVSKTKELEEFAAETKERVQIIETKNDNLNREKGSLEVKIANLNTEIDETNKKLEDSEGDRTFLEGELFRLQEEKAELVKQMNDIEFLSAQVKRIKNDIAVARRMDWMRRGIGIYAKRQTVGQQHAALREDGTNKKPVIAGSKEEGNVSVELTSDGRVIINGKVIESAGEIPETAPAPPVPQE